MELEA
jgi:hypothetical protein